MGKGNKRERFVEEYLVDLNATKAAIRAGYSERSARSIASELLADPEIQEAIKKGKDARSKRTTISQDQVLMELARIAFSDLRHFAEWGGPQGILIKCSEDLGTKARVVSEISNTAYGVKIKLHSKPRALELLARHLGILSGDAEEAAKAVLSFAELAQKAAAAKKKEK